MELSNESESAGPRAAPPYEEVLAMQVGMMQEMHWWKRERVTRRRNAVLCFCVPRSCSLSLDLV